ncbi:MAG: threonylcarbamoyl-AMP synthase, partial [Flavobacteriaceae bacterium]|nr:threonylcarbamoyl-AMP synthase [Flavobacteriaceae bacterium]
MQQEIEQALVTLQKGGLILYPTDTVWGIGCDATNENAVQKMFQLKKRHESKALICLVSSLVMLEKIVNSVPQSAIKFLENPTKPTTIIYDNPQGIAKNLIAEDNTLAVRVVSHEFCEQLIRKLKKPIVSTSANISSEKTPKSFQEISKEILEGVINLDKVFDVSIF